MAKDTGKAEAMLYQLYLDLFFAAQDVSGAVDDFATTLKDLKDCAKKTKKNLASVTARYEALYGRKPSPPKN